MGTPSGGRLLAVAGDALATNAVGDVEQRMPPRARRGRAEVATIPSTGASPRTPAGVELDEGVRDEERHLGHALRPQRSIDERCDDRLHVSAVKDLDVTDLVVDQVEDDHPRRHRRHHVPVRLAPTPIRSRAGVEARAEVVATPADSGDRQPTHLVGEVVRIGAERTVKLGCESGRRSISGTGSREPMTPTTMTAQAGVIARRTSAS